MVKERRIGLLIGLIGFPVLSGIAFSVYFVWKKKNKSYNIMKKKS
jgi:hypothetical protein